MGIGKKMDIFLLDTNFNNQINFYNLDIIKVS